MGIPIRLVILVGALLTSAPIWAYYGVDYDHERPEKSLDSTIVPIHSRAYRMTQPDGRIRMLGRDPDHPNFLYGNGGWQGDIRGDEIEVYSEESLVDGTERTRFVFKGGLLEKLVLEGREYPFVRPKPPVRDLASLWPKDSGPTKEDLRKAAIWTGSDRLRLFYVNRNAAGAFLCMVALTILGLTLRQQWPVAVIGAILALGAVLLLVQTGSRSGLLAFALGLGIELFVILRKAFSWKLVVGLLLGVAISAGLASRSPQFEKLTGRLLEMDAGVPVVPGAAVPLETVVVVPAALPVGPVVLPIGGSAAVVPEAAVVEEAGAAAEGAAEAADVDPPGPMVDSVLVLPEAPVPVVPGAAVPEEAAAEEVPVYFPVLSST